jgi:hypothetical protein
VLGCRRLTPSAACTWVSDSRFTVPARLSQLRFGSRT